MARFELAISWSRTKRDTMLRYTQITVETTGFEPATSCTPSKRTTRLCYVSMKKDKLFRPGVYALYR